MKKYHRTILVIEDEPSDQMLIKSAFKHIGLTSSIKMVNDGAEAIAYLMGEGNYSDRTKYPYPTFIITDLKMPREDGFAVLDFLKSNREWSVIPTVVLTASSDPDDIKKSYMLGASSYHIKPISFEDLEKQISLLNEYWLTCEVPEVSVSGKQLPTAGAGKLGERFRSSATSIKTSPERVTQPQ
jgi:CheY-like chemotaxis protein